MDKTDIQDELLPSEGAGRDELLELYLMGPGTAADPKTEARRTAAEVVLSIGQEYLQKPKDREQLILMAIAHCCNRSLPIPKWCQDAFLNAYTAVKWDYSTDTWDNVFGKPFPKNTQIDSKQKFNEKSGPVWTFIQRKKKENPKRSLNGNLYDNGLFEEAAKEFCISAGTAREYYYYWVHHHRG